MGQNKDLQAMYALKIHMHICRVLVSALQEIGHRGICPSHSRGNSSFKAGLMFKEEKSNNKGSGTKETEEQKLLVSNRNVKNSADTSVCPACSHWVSQHSHGKQESGKHGMVGVGRDPKDCLVPAWSLPCAGTSSAWAGWSEPHAVLSDSCSGCSGMVGHGHLLKAGSLQHPWPSWSWWNGLTSPPRWLRQSLQQLPDHSKERAPKWVRASGWPGHCTQTALAFSILLFLISWDLLGRPKHLFMDTKDNDSWLKFLASEVFYVEARLFFFFKNKFFSQNFSLLSLHLERPLGPFGIMYLNFYSTYQNCLQNKNVFFPPHHSHCFQKVKFVVIKATVADL